MSNDCTARQIIETPHQAIHRLEIEFVGHIAKKPLHIAIFACHCLVFKHSVFEHL